MTTSRPAHSAVLVELGETGKSSWQHKLALGSSSCLYHRTCANEWKTDKGSSRDRSSQDYDITSHPEAAAIVNM